MAKQIILKNTTGADILYGGRLIPAGDQNEFTSYTTQQMREMGEEGLFTDIENEDIVVNDGTKDLSAEFGRSYISNDFDTEVPILVNNTGAIVIPIGTTAQRPSLPLDGMLRRNTDLAALELYQDGIWTPVGIWGMYYTYVRSLSVTTTTQNSWLQKVRLTTPNVVAGTYRVAWSYQWNHNDTGSDFESKIELDDTTIVAFYKQEPADSRSNDGETAPNPGEINAGGAFLYSTTGNAQRHSHEGSDILTLGAGVHTLDLDFRSDKQGRESSVWGVTLEFWRLA